MKTSPNALAAWVRKYHVVSETTLALTFAEYNDSKWRFNVDEGRWLEWVGNHWARGHSPELLDSLRNFLMVFALAFRQAQRINPSEAVKLQSTRTLKAVEQLCRNLPSFLARSASFDADPFLLGTPGGTVDLRTGEMRKSDPGDMITILAKVTPAPRGTPCPKWMAFMMQVMAGNTDLIKTMQMWAGISASGTARDQRLMFIYGSGRNGKGVWCRVVAGLIGDHTTSAPRDMFVQQGKFRQHLTELTDVVAARMVLAAEIPEGAEWDVALINQLTGGDEMAVRKVKENLYKVVPGCSITIMGNLKPELKTVDDAVRGRFLVVTFPVFIPEADRIMDFDKLLIAEEGPAILRWVIDGAVAREQAGVLHVAECIREDTKEYMAEQNIMADFIETYLEVAPPGTDPLDPVWRVKTSDIYELWRGFCGRFGRAAGYKNSFTTSMKAAGVVHKKIDNGRYFLGVRKALAVFD